MFLRSSQKKCIMVIFEIFNGNHVYKMTSLWEKVSSAISKILDFLQYSHISINIRLHCGTPRRNGNGGIKWSEEKNFSIKWVENGSSYSPLFLCVTIFIKRFSFQRKQGENFENIEQLKIFPVGVHVIYRILLKALFRYSK